MGRRTVTFSIIYIDSDIIGSSGQNLAVFHQKVATLIILGEPSCVIIRYISNNCNQGISNNQRTEMYNVRGLEAQELSTIMHPMSIFAVVSLNGLLTSCPQFTAN